MQPKIPASKQIIKDLNDKLNRSVDIDIHQQALNRIQMLEKKCENQQKQLARSVDKDVFDKVN